MDNIIQIFGVACVGVMLAGWFQPIQRPKRWLIEKTKPSSTIYLALDKALNCPKCMSFWVYLIVDQNVFRAALCAFIGHMISHIIDKTEAWYE